MIPPNYLGGPVLPKLTMPNLALRSISYYYKYSLTLSRSVLVTSTPSIIYKLSPHSIKLSKYQIPPLLSLAGSDEVRLVVGLGLEREKPFPSTEISIKD